MQQDFEFKSIEDQRTIFGTQDIWVYMDEEGKTDENILLARTAPERILSGKMPRLIDEWQFAPSLWDAIRFRADRLPEPGGYTSHLLLIFGYCL